jgi:Fic family protein
VTLSNKGAKLQQEKSKWYEILPQPRDTHKKGTKKFQLDMWKDNEIISRKP